MTYHLRPLYKSPYNAGMSPAIHPMYRFGEYEVDTRARTLKRGNTAVILSRRSFDLLLYFVQNSGRVLSKDELLKNIWPDTFVDENSLAKSISVLRKALDESPLESNLVVTVPGRGYQFAGAVELSGPAAVIEYEEPLTRDVGLSPSGSAALQRGWTRNSLGGGALCRSVGSRLAQESWRLRRWWG